MPSKQTQREREERAKHPSISHPINYRNRFGRSGLDPMDTYREIGTTPAVPIRRLLTGGLRPRDPFMIGLMAIGAFIFLCPVVVMIGGMIRSRIPIWDAIFWNGICAIPLGILGLSFSISIAGSLIEIIRAKRKHFHHRRWNGRNDHHKRD